jgi:hypothetical protein
LLHQARCIKVTAKVPASPPLNIGLVFACDNHMTVQNVMKKGGHHKHMACTIFGQQVLESMRKRGVCSGKATAVTLRGTQDIYG